MIDQNSQFFAILTAVGEAKQANADALGVPWTIAQMGVGDANGTDPIPSRTQPTLINERRRAPLNQLKVDPANPGIIIAEQVIPEDIGGWWIREIGLYDAAGDLVAVANCAPSFKPQLSQGSGRTQVVRMNLIVTSTANVELKIDPSVVLATRAYCDGKVAEELAKLDHKQSVRYATIGAIALAGLAVQAGGDWAVPLTAGDRVLVKNQADGKDNCFYTAAVGAWVRATDADISAEVTSGLIVAVESGTTLADTRWQLVTDGTIVLGTTALTFQDVTKGYAPLSSPTFTDNPTAPTPGQFDNDTSLATTAFVQRALGNWSGSVPFNATGSITVGQVGKAAYFFGEALGQTISLPNTAGLPIGASVPFFNISTAPVTIQVHAGGTIDIGGNYTGQATSVVVPPGSFVMFAYIGGVQWMTAGLARASTEFGSSITANGYKRYPDANSPTGYIIEQWGTFSAGANTAHNVPFPIVFPNACVNVEVTSWNNSLAAGTVGQSAWLTNQGDASYSMDGYKTSGFRCFTNTNSAVGLKFKATGF